MPSQRSFAALRYAVSTLALVCAVPGLAMAQSQQTTTDATASKPEVEVQQVIVTAVPGRAAAAAPVKSSLAATEPEAVITRKEIEEVAPRVGDYTTTAILAPSMATTPNANGPGATDGAKLTMRGFQDGEFNVTYDGIAWGDTNGPSHHANSFFPSSVIGGVVIDRGPGRASDFGQANFGGSVNLFSLPFEDKPGFRQTATLASFGTYQAVTTLDSGPLDGGWHGANFVANFMEYRTDGYLTHSPSSGENQFIKGMVPINNAWSITALYTHNTDKYNQGDNNANGTLAQTTLYGKRFALGTNPAYSTFDGYNFTKKATDFEYIRLNGDIGHGLTVENTVYSYFYDNNTYSANNNAADPSSNLTFANFGTTPSPVVSQVVTTFPSNTPTAAYPAAGSGYSKTLQTAGIPGYYKRNEYRVLGDILKFHQDTPWGKLSFGAEFEHAFTQRQRLDFDWLTGLDDYREKAATTFNTSSTGHCTSPIRVATGPSNGACEVPLDIAYDEYSGWNQYQPFIEFDWKPLDNLTITPGVKYVHFELFIHAPELAVSGSIQPSWVSGTYTKTLPFLTANYRIKSNWTVYAQYAQGFLVPNISSFYVNAPANNHVVPQESTNYQLGTVFNAGKLTFDGDIYYIDFKHKIQTITITDPTSSINGETYDSNSGGAVYKGVEAQATYLLPYGFAVFANGSLNQATAENDPLNPGGNGKQIAKAPRWTAAQGFRYEHHALFSADDDIISNIDTKWIGQQFQTAASGTTGPTGLIHSFNETDWTTTYRFNHYSIEFQVLDLLDNTSITSFKGKGLLPGTNIPITSLSQANASTFAAAAANVFTYQTGRSFQVTFKAAF